MLPFRHPTTTLVLDDDPLFLESFGYRFGRSLTCHTANFPQTAIDQIMADARRLESLHDVFEPFAGSVESQNIDAPQCLLRLNRRPLATIANDPLRRSTISVIVVDFAMPSMSGMDVCREIKSAPVKKILLTGKAGDQTAVAAFNDGLIDCFLVKQDPNLITKLPAEIRRLEGEFFRSLARPLTLAARSSELGFLADEKFMRQLEQEFQSKRIIEHYLWDNPPGFLTVDAEQRRRFCIIYDDETMRAQFETANEGNAPPELVQLLAQGKSIVALPTMNGFYMDEFSAIWSRYTAQAHQVLGTRWHVADAEAALYLS